MALPDDALCLQDGQSPSPIAVAATLPDAIAVACLELCRGRPDLLVHAFCAPRDGAALGPLGKLFGDEAINHGGLGATLFRLGKGATAFTETVLELGRPVWSDTIPRFGWNGLAAVLRSHGVRSGGAFPIRIGARVAAVIEVFSFNCLQMDLASEALAAELEAQIAERFPLHAV